MSGKAISRRAFAGGALLFVFQSAAAKAQGFAGLGTSAEGFSPVVPGKKLVFPEDHGAHPDFRIEWWYVTANLADGAGSAYGVQWTLFRQAMAPGPQVEGWANQQVWMAHAAVTRADTHRFAETFARGGVGQAGAEAVPFHTWIDAWQMRGRDDINSATMSPLEINAAGADFDYALRLESSHALVLQGDDGYSVKSEQGQASYYYSQ
ncbi:MAG TPA: lipocalin-like domain-containing protein, partial [Bradyrhizobium sp.]|uniref:lipocalin-like domain-containing protein n=1 Tax=Bradyrhizobium sp. TaxID=376 RepID=UPI002D810A50